MPYLIALVTSANIGSAMTLTENPQNISTIVGSVANMIVIELSKDRASVSFNISGRGYQLLW